MRRRPSSSCCFRLLHCWTREQAGAGDDARYAFRPLERIEMHAGDAGERAQRPHRLDRETDALFLLVVGLANALGRLSERQAGDLRESIRLLRRAQHEDTRKDLDLTA